MFSFSYIISVRLYIQEKKELKIIKMIVVAIIFFNKKWNLKKWKKVVHNYINVIIPYSYKCNNLV